MLTMPTQTYKKKAVDGKIVVGVADMAVTSDPDALLITYALGSCIGVTIFDPVACVGGMLHFMLPNSKGSPDKAKANPAMFGDTGVPLLFRMCYDLGATKENMVVCAAGGAEILADDGHFKIGSRNRTILRKLFWKNSILVAAEDTGGVGSRTLQLNVPDGHVEIRSKGNGKLLWPE